VVGDESSGEAIVIDPGDEVDRILEILKRHRLRTKYIVATHAHIDHVGGFEKLKDATGALVLIHRDDLPLYQNVATQAEWLGVAPPSTVEVDQFLREGDSLRWGSLELHVLHTPGHSPGSISLHMSGEEQKIFSGDTLFQGSVGRTDLWGGSYEQILRSIESKLLPLPDAALVFPGHGASTTIGEERESNPFLRGL
jgi:hydroxyacylglutathione hydrolase